MYLLYATNVVYFLFPRELVYTITQQAVKVTFEVRLLNAEWSL